MEVRLQMVSMILVSKALPTLNGTKVVVAQLYPTLCDPKDYSPPGSSVHGILQATILERLAIPFSRGSSRHKDQTPGLLHCSWILYHLSHQRSSSQCD